MNNQNGFRVGFQPFMLMPPQDVAAPMDKYKWTLDECRRLGAKAISFMPYFIPEGASLDTFKEMAAMAKEADVSMIIYPFTMWGVAGLPRLAAGQTDAPNAAEARAGVEKMMGLAGIFGSDIFCMGYGQLNVATSRYNKQFPLSEQRKFIVANLKVMADMLKGTNIKLAYENHVDFTGKEIAGIIEEVASSNVGSLYDFGNAALIGADPMEDAQYLAPYAVAAHFKDFKAMDNPLKTDTWPDMPIRIYGSYVGEGFIDFDVILQTIIDKAPNPKGMLLLAEPAFILPETDEEKADLKEFDRKVTRQYVTKMLEIVQKF